MTTRKARKLTPGDQFLVEHQNTAIKSFLLAVKQANYLDAKSHLESAFADSEALGGKQP
jgi:hypothetical protein